MNQEQVNKLRAILYGDPRSPHLSVPVDSPAYRGESIVKIMEEEKEKEKEMSYRFKTIPAEMDLARVILENPGTPAILVVGPKNAVILIDRGWAQEQYDASPIKVRTLRQCLGETLSQAWGWGAGTMDKDGRFLFAEGFPDDLVLAPGWGGRELEHGEIEIALGELRQVILEEGSRKAKVAAEAVRKATEEMVKKFNFRVASLRGVE